MQITEIIEHFEREFGKDLAPEAKVRVEALLDLWEWETTECVARSFDETTLRMLAEKKITQARERAKLPPETEWDRKIRIGESI